jgi:hypothetical protein
LTKHEPIWGFPGRRPVDVLPSGFDKDMVSDFFNGIDRTGNTGLSKAAPGKATRLPDDSEKAAPAAESVAQGLDVAGEPLTNARSILEQLGKELPEGPHAEVDPAILFDDDVSGAGARPSGKGGGNDPDKATGKGKNKPVQEEQAEESTSEPAPAPEPAPEPATAPATEPTPETNPGSTDPNTYVSGLDTPNGFNIEILFNGAWTDVLKQGFYDAAEYYSDIITGDLASHNGVDDIQISANLSNIDGSGGFWGWGGTSSVRSDTLLPSKGYVNIDSSDLDTMDSYGLWDDLILHEMGHALGFGTSWASMGLIDNYDGDLRFNGANATQAYNDDYSDKAGNDALSDLGVPVETDGGSGTAGVHWDDQTFGGELMTGQLNFTNTLSDMSIAALEDMGYDTVYDDGHDTTYDDTFLFM